MSIESEAIPLVGQQVHFWIDDHTCVFAIVAKVHEQATLSHPPKVNLCFLSPELAKWVSKLEVDPVVDMGDRVYKAQRWCLLNEYKPELKAD